MRRLLCEASFCHTGWGTVSQHPQGSTGGREPISETAYSTVPDPLCEIGNGSRPLWLVAIAVADLEARNQHQRAPMVCGVDVAVLEVDKGCFARAEEDESRRLGRGIAQRREADASVRHHVVVPAVGQADPQIVATPLRWAVGADDAGRSILEDHQVAGVRLERDVVDHAELL